MLSLNPTRSNNATLLKGCSLQSLIPIQSHQCNAVSSAKDILKKPPFAPTDVNLFMPQVYSMASSTVPAAANTISDAQLQKQLNSTLLKRLDGDTRSVTQTSALMNDPKLKQIVPDSRLRAGLLSLKGTVGQSAIDAIRSGAFSSVTFGTLPPSNTFEENNAIAQVVPPATGQTKPGIVINSKYQYEDFRLLGDVLSHETLHQDPSNGGKEELINNVIDSTVYGQILLDNPELATSGTELTRRLNTKLMARLNSRDANGELRISTAQGNVYPGGQELANFGAAFNTAGSPDTAGNATLRNMLKSIIGNNRNGVGDANFDNSTIALLDKNQNVFSDKEVVQLAKILKLNIPN